MSKLALFLSAAVLGAALALPTAAQPLEVTVSIPPQ
jgi:hypothetical protein